MQIVTGEASSGNSQSGIDGGTIQQGKGRIKLEQCNCYITKYMMLHFL